MPHRETIMAKAMGSQQEGSKKVPLHLVTVIDHMGTTKDLTAADHKIMIDLMTISTKHLVMANIPALHTIEAIMMSKTPESAHNS